MQSLKNSSDKVFVIGSNPWNLLQPCRSIVQVEHGTVLIPVWSKFTISSAGNTFHGHCCKNISKETFLLFNEVCFIFLALALVLDLTLDKFHFF